MKGLFLALVLIAGVGGAGVYMGWFHFSSDNTPGESKVTVTVDKDKLGADKDKAKGKLQDLGQKVKEKASEIGHKPTTAN